MAQESSAKSKPKAKPTQRASQTDWYSLFKNKKLSPEDASKVVFQLHQAKHYGDVIELIEAALATGQSQSWMYDVLPWMMQLDGRPAEDIERVVLSRVDFTVADVDNMLLSAAFLVRLDGKSAALSLYQHASKLDPARPEPYLLSLKLAKESKDSAAIQWAACGILETTWTKDRVKRQQEAEDAATDAIKRLEKDGQAEAANRFKQAIAEAKRRDLIVRLEWDGAGDLDLEVSEPFGTTCSVQKPLSPGGGVHTHDGYGPVTKNCFDEYICVKGGSGAYRVKVLHNDGNIIGKRCTLIIQKHVGSQLAETETIPIKLEKPTYETAFILTNGRRKEKGPTPMAEAPTKPVSRQEMMAKLLNHTLPNSVRSNVVHAQFGGGVGGPGTILQAGGQRPFVGGAVGLQPVIGVVNDGVSLTVSAITSADRRYVKIAIAPVFSSLVEMATFSISN